VLTPSMLLGRSAFRGKFTTPHDGKFTTSMRRRFKYKVKGRSVRGFIYSSKELCNVGLLRRPRACNAAGASAALTAGLKLDAEEVDLCNWSKRTAVYMTHTASGSQSSRLASSSTAASPSGSLARCCSGDTCRRRLGTEHHAGGCGDRKGSRRALQPRTHSLQARWHGGEAISALRRAEDTARLPTAETVFARSTPQAHFRRSQ